MSDAKPETRPDALGYKEEHYDKHEYVCQKFEHDAEYGTEAGVTQFFFPVSGAAQRFDAVRPATPLPDGLHAPRRAALTVLEDQRDA